MQVFKPHHRLIIIRNSGIVAPCMVSVSVMILTQASVENPWSTVITSTPLDFATMLRFFFSPKPPQHQHWNGHAQHRFNDYTAATNNPPNLGGFKQQARWFKMHVFQIQTQTENGGFPNSILTEGIRLMGTPVSIQYTKLRQKNNECRESHDCSYSFPLAETCICVEDKSQYHLVPKRTRKHDYTT